MPTRLAAAAAAAILLAAGGYAAAALATRGPAAAPASFLSPTPTNAGLDREEGR